MSRESLMAEIQFKEKAIDKDSSDKFDNCSTYS